MPIINPDTGEVEWVHAKDFDPEIHFCSCPVCQKERILKPFSYRDWKPPY